MLEACKSPGGFALVNGKCGQPRSAHAVGHLACVPHFAL